jgi:S-adenosylmethionine hydrolase
MLRADGRWFVGPDNGLFAIVARRAGDVEGREIAWRPDRLSASFQGRDLFAPVAARLATGQAVASAPRGADTLRRRDWPDDLARIVYIDGFGNAMTGTRAATVAEGAQLEVAGRCLDRARTFGDVPTGEVFWYENANGLAEIAVNKGRADRSLGIEIGTEVDWTIPTD